MEFVCEARHFELDNHPSYYEHIEFADAEHDENLADGSFTEVDDDFAKCIYPLQVEENRKKKLRMCSDLRFPNAYQAHPILRLESLDKHMPDVVCKGDYMVTTDMKKAYFSVPMHESAWPYLWWRHRDKIVCATILEFGACQAPRFFHKIMRVIVQSCRKYRIRMMNIVVA